MQKGDQNFLESLGATATRLQNKPKPPKISCFKAPDDLPSTTPSRRRLTKSDRRRAGGRALPRPVAVSRRAHALRRPRFDGGRRRAPDPRIWYHGTPLGRPFQAHRWPAAFGAGARPTPLLAKRPRQAPTHGRARRGPGGRGAISWPATVRVGRRATNRHTAANGCVYTVSLGPKRREHCRERRRIAYRAGTAHSTHTTGPPERQAMDARGLQRERRHLSRWARRPRRRC